MVKLPRWTTVPALTCLAVLALRLAAAQQAAPQAPGKITPAIHTKPTHSIRLIRPKPNGILCVVIDSGDLGLNQIKKISASFTLTSGAAENGWVPVGTPVQYTIGGHNILVLKFRAPATAPASAPAATPARIGGIHMELGAGTGGLTVTISPTDGTGDVSTVPPIAVDDTGVDPCDAS
jgi:hypothetical protein